MIEKKPYSSHTKINFFQDKNKYVYFLPLFVLLPILLLLFFAVCIVPQGFQYTSERFGRYTKTLSPGLHFLIPFIDRIGVKVNMMENVYDIHPQDVITKDNAAVTVDGVVFYQVLDAYKASYEVRDLLNAILTLTMANIRTVMGSMELDELLSQREAIGAQLLSVIDEATAPWGTKVTRIQIKDIKPPKDILDAMARQMKAERDKRALILEAEGERQASILGAEGKRQAAILKAEGEKFAMILGAEGQLESAERNAKARERLAEAEAKATKDVSQAVEAGSAQALNYFVAQKYVEALTAFANSPNQKVLMMPLEATSLMGTISGIAEMVKNTFEESGAAIKSTKKPLL